MRDFKSTSSKAGENLPSRLKAARIASVLRYSLSLYPSEQLQGTESADLFCLSLFLLDWVCSMVEKPSPSDWAPLSFAFLMAR